MKVCYRKSDGLYCDTEGSWPFRYPGDEEFVKGPNVIERFGGEVEDYVVVDAGPHTALRIRITHLLCIVSARN